MAYTKLLATLVIGLAIGMALGYGAFSATSVPATMTSAVQQAKIPSQIPIGLLITLTGELSDEGPLYRATALIAQNDVNAYLASSGLNYTVQVYMEDTGTTGAGALTAVQALAAKGIQVIISYLSVDIRSTMSYVDENHIVEISYASTAPSLAGVSPYIFRLVPNDLHQSNALAHIMWSVGIRNAVVAYRNDAWGTGLSTAFQQIWTGLGGKINSLGYDPSAKDLSAEALELSGMVTSFGVNNSTGVLDLSFDDDAIALFTAIQNNAALTSVRWFGSDGSIGSPRLRDTYSSLVEKVWYPSTVYTVPSAPNQKNYTMKWQAATGESVPSSYQYALYDAVFLSTLATLQAGVYDGAAIQKVFAQVADHYYGLSGWTVLDSKGDRAFAPYEIERIVPTAGIPNLPSNIKAQDWLVVGYYSEETNAVTWVSPQAP
jgi:branched-chain amino acid transport system substrate-binding protein